MLVTTSQTLSVAPQIPRQRILLRHAGSGQADRDQYIDKLGEDLREIPELKMDIMLPNQLYPLRFDPIYQYRLWGGRRLANLLSAPLPGAGPIGEAWLLSDRADHPSLVANGPLKGRTI